MVLRVYMQMRLSWDRLPSLRQFCIKFNFSSDLGVCKHLLFIFILTCHCVLNELCAEQVQLRQSLDCDCQRVNLTISSSLEFTFMSIAFFVRKVITSIEVLVP